MAARLVITPVKSSQTKHAPADHSYVQERRRDSLALVAPAVAIGATLFSLLGLAGFSGRDMNNYPSLWLVVLAAPLVFVLTRRLLKVERQATAGWFFCLSHLLLLTILYVDFWHAQSALPYFYGLFIVAGDKLVRLTASFALWAISCLFLLGGLFLVDRLTLTNLGYLALPMLLNFLLALMSFLSTIDWQLALESVTEVQRRAQRRRDELFVIQEKLSLANARLNHTNAELERARREALRERDLRTRFMHNVSHELRTPLNAVVNLAHILASGVRGPLADPQVDYLQRIEKSGRHVLHVLNDLLDLAQIESGEFKLYPERISLEGVCEDAMCHLRGLVWEKPIALIRDYPDEWPVVEADRTRLTQALINLLGNAAKYTEEGHIALRVRPAGDIVHLIVEDTGIGIDPAYHELIFQEFRQVDERAARRRIGTGLGLPITRHLIERHSGQVAVDSAPGRGSKFIIILPLSQEAALPLPSPSATPA